jgi:hypothetical protein
MDMPDRKMQEAQNLQDLYERRGKKKAEPGQKIY